MSVMYVYDQDPLDTLGDQASISASHLVMMLSNPTCAHNWIQAYAGLQPAIPLHT